jgi:Protein of unknown function (DUF2934)
MAKRTTRSKNQETSGKETSTATTEPGGYPAGPATADDRSGATMERDSSSESMSSEANTRNESMASEPSEEEIRMRAYRRYLERGGADGQDFEDWLEAERELKQGR